MRSERLAPGDRRLADELANIRMMADRGNFEQARNLCRTLLGDSPDDPDLHAAMGDVFGTEGRWADAIKWYELALELDFDPTVMERLAAARGHSIRNGTAAAAGPQVAVPRRPQPVEQGDAGRRRQAVALVALGVILLSAIGFLIFRPGKASPGDEGGASGGPTARAGAAPTTVGGYGLSNPATPTAPGQTLAGTGLSAPPAGEASEARYTGHPPVSSGAAPAPAGGSDDVPVAELYSRIEQHVLGRMKLDKWREGTGVSPSVSLALDDLAGIGILTIRAPRTGDADRLEQEVLLSAFRAAVSAMRADNSLRELTVRCVVRIPGEAGADDNTVIFRTRATRDSLGRWLGVSQLPTAEQIRQGVLGEIWWDRDALLHYLQARGGAREPGDGEVDEGPGSQNP